MTHSRYLHESQNLKRQLSIFVLLFEPPHASDEEFAHSPHETEEKRRQTEEQLELRQGDATARVCGPPIASPRRQRQRLRATRVTKHHRPSCQFSSQR